MRDGADGFWYDHGGNNWGLTTSAGGDVDADGLQDVIVNGAGEFVLFRGRAGPLPFGDDVGSEVILTADVDVAQVAVLSDLDGDGVDEALATYTLSYQGSLGFIDAAHLAESGPIGAALNRVDASEVEGTLRFLTGGASGLGDFDGDGYAAILESTDARSDGGDTLYTSCITGMRGAALLTSGDLSDRLSWRLCDVEEAYGLVGFDSTTTPDVDGDEVRDLMWAGADTTSYGGMDDVQCLVPSHRLPASGRVSLSEVGFCMWGGDGSIGTGALADLDGDGLPELLGDEPHWSRGAEAYVGRTLVVPGFEIPWDDPSKW